MKLADHAENIRQLIDRAFRNRLGRMGITSTALQHAASIPADYQADRARIEGINEVLIAETGNKNDAYEKLVEELSFTLFNRIAALKVMEAHTLHPEIITRRSQHGDRSFAHLHWLEQNPEGKNEEQEGLLKFIENQLSALSGDIPLFSLNHPYHLLPTVIELNAIINAFNQVDADPQVETDIWKSDDVLGWLYESYNNSKKAAHKESGDKTEYNKVSIQSQVYTPRWVVKFLVDNSLGKLYLEMYPDSIIKNKYKIANAPSSRTRDIKPLTDIRLIDPATGSGNFLLYAFDLFYDLYKDQINNYGAEYNEKSIPELILKHNLHGVDLDDRAIQLAQLGLYIKAKRIKRGTKIVHFNIVSSDFFLPVYSEVKHLFQVNGKPLDADLEKIVVDLWSDLQQAYKFGSLIRLDEEFNNRLQALIDVHKKEQGLFSHQAIEEYNNFRETFFTNLQKAVEQNTAKQGVTFLNTKTQDAITFLQLLTQKYDVAVANPPYTDGGDFGPELKKFIEVNYKKPFKFNSNLYVTFIKRCCELTDNTNGKIGMLHPLTFMYITSFKDVRAYILENLHINILAELGLGGVFADSDVQANVVAYVVEKNNLKDISIFLDFKKYKNHSNKPKIFMDVYTNLMKHFIDGHVFMIYQSKLKIIDGWPFIYWISDGFRDKFKVESLEDEMRVCTGLSTAHNNRFLRFWWEIEKTKIGSDWKLLAKGGPYNKWWGNIWLTVNWKKDGYEIKNNVDDNGKVRSRPNNEKYYFQSGITNSLISDKGISNRLLPENMIFDITAPSIFSKKYDNLFYVLGYLNSKIVQYISDCLNSTVALTWGDLQRIPFIKPKKELEKKVTSLASLNIEIKKNLCSFHIIETNFNKTPLSAFSGITLRERLLAYFNFENAQLTQVLLNEAIINELIFEVFELSAEDRLQIEIKMGQSSGSFPVLSIAREEFLSFNSIENETVKNHINDLKIISFDEQQKHIILSDFAMIYQGNNDLEDFCVNHQINPINLWYWIKEAKVLPQARTAQIAMEFFTDAVCIILDDDDDGIIPLVGQLGEEKLLDRLEKHCIDTGFSPAQFMQLDSLLGSTMNDFIENKFFRIFCDHIKLFKHLPSTPFIWHLSSGTHQGLEVYISIYKWSRDNLYRLKNLYISKRIENLEFRQIQLKDSDTAQAQAEKETVRLQLLEIADFSKKIDELIAEGYDPKLDDGVGKNIAPLQKKGLLKCDVLKGNQLELYLKADW